MAEVSVLGGLVVVTNSPTIRLTLPHSSFLPPFLPNRRRMHSSQGPGGMVGHADSTWGSRSGGGTHRDGAVGRGVTAARGKA